MTAALRSTITLLADAVFPVFCLGCGQEGTWVCADCSFGLDTGGVFRDCVFPLARVTAVLPYREAGLIGSLIHAYKYEYVTAIEPIFFDAMNRFLTPRRTLFSMVDAVMPVPLHPRRYAERGFNQAGVIADFLGRQLEKPVLFALERHRYTLRQARLGREDRQNNVVGAFRVAPAADLRGLRVLLVDDIYTTGATMGECAKTLLSRGAKEVSGFVIARG